MFVHIFLFTADYFYFIDACRNTMNIRIATPADAPAISNIHTINWRIFYENLLNKTYLQEEAAKERDELWRQRFENPEENQVIYVAEIDGKTVGFSCFYIGENLRWGTYLEVLHVLEGYQSQGIGEALLKHCAKVSYEHDQEKGLCLIVNQTNYRGQQFFLRHGARNAQHGLWNAPDGTPVPTYMFIWDNFSELL